MTRGKRLRYAGLLVGAAALVLLMVGPVFGANHPDVDRLRLTDDFQGFLHGGPQPDDGGPVVEQYLAPDKACLVTSSSAEIATFDNIGGKGAGFVQLGIGVKSGGAKGTACSQVSDDEKLVIIGANSWTALRLDIEVKGNARVYVELSMNDIPGDTVTHQLLTGRAIEDYNNNDLPDGLPDGDLPEESDTELPYSATTEVGDEINACADPIDSGSDNVYNDNCLWSINPGVAFDRVVIWATNGGSVTLKGGADYETLDAGLFAAGEFDSLFFRAVSAASDSYEMDEREPVAPFAVATLIVPNTSDVNVLDNDSGQNLTVVPVPLPEEGSFNTTEEGRFTIDTDGFEYTPKLDYDWSEGEFSYQDTFDYEVFDSDVPLDKKSATVTITVHRVICSGEEVTDTSISGNVIGTFALLSGPDICKRYGVEALDGIGSDPSTITFTPEDNEGDPEKFRGVLTFDPQEFANGGFFVGLTYDPDNDGTFDDDNILLFDLPSRPLLPCIAPEFGLLDADFPLVTGA